MEDPDELIVDPLFVGLTRPATILGVPYGAVVFEFVSAAVVFLGSGNPLYLLVVVPVHLVLYLISATNPGAFAAIGLWLKTCAKCQNTLFWKAASFSPQQSKKWPK